MRSMLRKEAITKILSMLKTYLVSQLPVRENRMCTSPPLLHPRDSGKSVVLILKIRAKGLLPDRLTGCLSFGIMGT